MILHSYSSQQSGCSTEGAHPVGFLPQISITDSSADSKLIEWLRNLQLDQGSIDKASNNHWYLRLPVWSYDKASTILFLNFHNNSCISTYFFPFLWHLIQCCHFNGAPSCNYILWYVVSFYHVSRNITTFQISEHIHSDYGLKCSYHAVLQVVINI